MFRSFLLPLVLFLPMALSAQEICDNGIDDDGDGLIDLNDTTDCTCGQVTTGPDESLIPNPSFEEQDCIPSTYSQLNCAHGWAQATQPTSDYFSTNGYMPSVFPPPVNGGIGFAGAYAFPGWQEYLGSCLDSPMLTGEEYSITFSLALFSLAGDFTLEQPMNYHAIDITIFGSTSCPSWPVDVYDCPVSAGWMELGHTTYSPSTDWSQITITFTPTVDIQAVILGSPCDLPPDYIQDVGGYLPYFIFDDLTLGERTATHVVVEDTGSFCTDDRVLIAHQDTVLGEYQWYLDGVALVGETDTILDLSTQGLGPGDYQFLVNVGDTACSVFPWPVADDVPPVLHFAAVPHTGCDPLPVVFTNTTAADSVSTIEWQFGDGGSSTVDDPTHTYTDAGTYDVTLTVTAPNGCIADTVLTDWIEVYPTPVASFTADPTEGCSGMEVQFTNTTGPLTDATSWTFGDGGSSTDENPLHTYTLTGHHDVHLTVTTADGCVDDTLMQQLIFTHPAPDVSFTAEPTEGCVPWTVQFINTTPAAQVDSVYWDFGQGDTSNDAAPSSIYDVPGVYDVLLSVTDNVGCTSDTTIADLVVTHGHPVPSFTFSPDSGCYPLEVAFVNHTDPSFNATCEWDFGDGGSSTICDTAHIYTEAGLYTVTLRTISEFGCDGDTTMADIITVFDHPEAGFTFGPQPTDVFQTQQVFVNTSSVDAITWDWLFEHADPDTSHIPDPVVLFPGGDPGEYAVQLIVSNEHTCLDTAAAVVMINGYFSVYAPNAFTPDGDGVNEGWRPIWKDLDPTSYQLRIFDRWGAEVWTSSDAYMPWDGKVGGSDPKPDVYVWKLEARDNISLKGHEFLGHVTIVR